MAEVTPRGTTKAGRHGLDEGDYLELMALYLLVHRMEDGVPEQSQWLLDKLHTLRTKYSPVALTKVLNDFHKTRKDAKSWKTTTCQSAPTATQSESNPNEPKP
jgi:hypothetical protein